MTKPTRRQLLRALIHRHLRAHIAAHLTTAEAAYDSDEYRRASWQETYEWGVLQGLLSAAAAAGVVHDLGGRIERGRAAADKRWQKIHAEKYAHLHLEEKKS